jgi:phosphopantothenate-cysteine ligase
MKKILITSGGTIEHIDDVRVLTNISTGLLASMVVDNLLKSFEFDTHILYKSLVYEVHYVYVAGSKLPNRWDTFATASPKPLYLYEVSNVASVMETMEKLVPQMDVVIHAMAVSDFGFKPIIYH